MSEGVRRVVAGYLEELAGTAAARRRAWPPRLA